MVFVPGGDYRLVAWGRPTDPRPKLADYFIDKYEVSNQDYKRVHQRRRVPQEGVLEAPVRRERPRAVLGRRDEDCSSTEPGCPGPRDWSQQKFPPALADHPVTGVSWYEAAAYAAFRGKELPTVFQWEKAARNGNAAPPSTTCRGASFFPGDSFRQRANFDGATTMPVTANPIGASPFGAYNMAGNVAEWCSERQRRRTFHERRRVRRPVVHVRPVRDVSGLLLVGPSRIPGRTAPAPDAGRCERDAHRHLV